MQEMVEPDRTIMIVSIIGLVVIWGSFFYHKFVQGGGGRVPADSVGEDVPPHDQSEGQKSSGKNKGKKRKENK